MELNNNDSVKTFKTTIDNITPEKEFLGAKDLTLWVGAGFSKCWDKTLPISKDLFNFTEYLFEEFKEKTQLQWYLENNYFIKEGYHFDYDYIKYLTYRLFVQNEFPEMQNKYMDKQLSKMLHNELRKMLFDKMKNNLCFSDSNLKFEIEMTKEKKKICSFIKYLNDKEPGQVLDSGLRLNFITTNYDFVIEEILSTVFKREDTLQYLTYRGFTPTTICGKNNYFNCNDMLIRNIFKINGGFEIINNENGLILEYRKDKLEEYYNDLNQDKTVILPSYHQDYNKEYFRIILSKTITLLRNSKILLIIGTSLPDEDYLFRQLLSNFAEQPSEYFNKKIFYISNNEIKEDLYKKLDIIFPGFEYENNIWVYNKGLLKFIDEFEAL